MKNKVYPYKIVLHTFYQFIVLNYILILSSDLYAQEQKNLINSTIESIDSMVSKSLQRDVGIIPAPSFNPSFGAGIAILPVFIFRPPGVDQATHPSTVQGLLFFNFTGSIMWGAKSTLYFNRNKFWLDFYMGYILRTLKFYGNNDFSTDQHIDIHFKGGASSFSFLSRIIPHFYIGPIINANYLQEKVDKLEEHKESPFLWYLTPGLKLSYDSRDDIFFPTSGWFSEFLYKQLIEHNNDPFKFDVVTLGVSNYAALNKSASMILANRLYSQIGDGTLPFHEKASPGASSILRGYIIGHYMDDSIISWQSEYRWMFSKRWGMVGFAGYGWLFDEPKNISESIGLPSIGAGLRYRLFTKFKINVALDVAFGRENANVYFSLSESF
jgi:hypothetical protein